MREKACQLFGLPSSPGEGGQGGLGRRGVGVVMRVFSRYTSRLTIWISEISVRWTGQRSAISSRRGAAPR